MSKLNKEQQDAHKFFKDLGLNESFSDCVAIRFMDALIKEKREAEKRGAEKERERCAKIASQAQHGVLSGLTRHEIVIKIIEIEEKIIKGTKA